MGKTGYEQTSIAEIREELKKLGVDEEFLKNSKSILVDKLISYHGPETTAYPFETGTIDGYQVERPIVFPINLEEMPVETVKETPAVMENPDQPVRPQTPEYGTVEWSEWVMSKFEKNELEKGNPKVDGLRRVAEEVLGFITIENRSIGLPHRDNKYTATVESKVNVSPFRLAYSQGRAWRDFSFTDVAEAGQFNTVWPYSAHPSATAATRAEGRALRKMLKLRNVVAAEELTIQTEQEAFGTEPEWEPESAMTQEQLTLLEIMCQRCDVNLWEFINAGKNKYTTVEEITKEKAAEMLKFLNDIQREIKVRPEKVSGWDKDWRQKLLQN